MRVLDLYCGAGGASAGYAQAGLEVVGVDIKPQKRYPFEFIQSDAIEYLTKHGHEYDLVHTSPPCQVHSKMTKQHGENDHAELIHPTRNILLQIGVPYVIENVEGAPLLNPTLLCGDMFALGCRYDGTFRRLRRHRLFETTFPVEQMPHYKHVGLAVGVYGQPGGSSKRDGLRFPDTAGWREAMQIDWMTADQMAQAIPPAYTKFIGEEFLNPRV